MFEARSVVSMLVCAREVVRVVLLLVCAKEVVLEFLFK